MKAKHTILLIALGYALEFVGALRRVTRAADSSALLLVAVILKVLGVLLLAYKIITYPGFRKFMDH